MADHGEEMKIVTRTCVVCKQPFEKLANVQRKKCVTCNAQQVFHELIIALKGEK